MLNVQENTEMFILTSLTDMSACHKYITHIKVQSCPVT